MKMKMGDGFARFANRHHHQQADGGGGRGGYFFADEEGVCVRAMKRIKRISLSLSQVY
jgi:hypothetical protein